MFKILVPVDGSRTSNYVVPYIIREFHRNRALRIHLLNVQPSFSLHVAQFTGRKEREACHRELGEKALAAARGALDGFGVPYAAHIEVGDRAKVITATAHRLGCDHIVMGTTRRDSFARMIKGSVTNQVMELTTVPVEVIAGDKASTLERFGLPAGIGAALGLLFLSTADY